MNKLACVSIASLIVLAGCNGSDKPNKMVTYDITVINASNNQPLSPLAVVLHKDNYIAWELGAPASMGLEELAESGSPMAFLQEFGDEAYESVAGTGIIPPGGSETVSLSIVDSTTPLLSVATMMVNTNDAFAGITGKMLKHLETGTVYSMALPIYDAGTEANSESAASIPGPAAGGEGLNTARDDFGFVAMHPGVVTADDGLSSSTLDESHRFASGSVILQISKQ